jgi:circadian clock protein KaiB
MSKSNRTSTRSSKPKNGKAKTDGKMKETFILRLFVTGILPNSVRAVENINAICEQYLKGRYDLEVIDIYQQPALALAEDIIAVPVLVKKFPFPEERLIGDLSDTERVLKGLHII